VSESVEKITLRLLEREYSFACPEEEREHLIKAADFLENRLKDIRADGRVVGVERIVMMAALNLSSELLKSETDKQQYIRDMNRRIHTLKAKIDQSINQK
jgi:cell division protein ZapA